MQKSGTSILFTPGPVSIAPRVLAAGSRPMIHHRTPEFHKILDNVIKKMKQLSCQHRNTQFHYAI